MPEPYTLIEAVLKDSAFSFIDNINTPNKETLVDLVTAAFKSAVPALQKAEASGSFNWSEFKDARHQAFITECLH